jgi:CubicO group peptidase (beta-lactamase class C family)
MSIQAAEERLQLRTLGPPWPPTPHTPDEWMRHFGALPLMHQPGEQWMYNTGAQVLGVLLLQRATG